MGSSFFITFAKYKLDRRGKYLAGEMPPHLLRDLIGEIRASVEHRQQHAEDVQLRIEPLFHGAERRHQVGQPLERVIFALHRDQNAVGGAEGVQREQLERGRAVDENVVVAVAQECETLLQAIFPLFDPNQLEELSLCFQLYIFITNCDMARSKDNSSYY